MEQDGQKYRQFGNDHSNQTSSSGKTNKKRPRSKSIDVEEPPEGRPVNVNLPYSARDNYRGPTSHNQDHNRGDEYWRPPNANNFGHRGRGNGQERFRNNNFRGRGRNYGGTYREGNGHTRGRF